MTYPICRGYIKLPPTSCLDVHLWLSRSLQRIRLQWSIRATSWTAWQKITVLDDPSSRRFLERAGVCSTYAFSGPSLQRIIRPIRHQLRTTFNKAAEDGHVWNKLAYVFGPNQQLDRCAVSRCRAALLCDMSYESLFCLCSTSSVQYTHTHTHTHTHSDIRNYLRMFSFPLYWLWFSLSLVLFFYILYVVTHTHTHFAVRKIQRETWKVILISWDYAHQLCCII